ncbi:hypothetical protein RRG08_053552 [Elysia crispata]|uniref:Sulfatase N-terminal domain-containing protein n=1 Tax=Elysia crispata TaxID=231223 RepID=A0AAE0Y1E8_9GAST|nr:hypothetical protein RRG08_053552 [Elysia crispata]
MSCLLFPVCISALVCSTLFGSVQAKGKHKNAVIFLVDDGGFMQSAYNNTVCDTPNLDYLSSRAVTFTRGYTGVSSCSPSRAVLLSGLPSHQNGMYGIQHSVHHFQSFDGVRSLPNILSNHGIMTGLVGKYHVAPKSVYTFDYMKTSPIDQVGRNITHMKHLIRKFLKKAKNADKPFLLYVAFFDTHRGGVNTWDRLGPFMNKWGSGAPGMGSIQDWQPKVYDPSKVIVPFFLPDTPAVREDIAAMYTTFNRMDQGVGLFLKELFDAGHKDNTLVLFSADNGIPFPAAKTNLYEPGMGEPMLISSPDHTHNWGKKSSAPASLMDFTPTVLDWFGVQYPQYKLNGQKVKLTGRSLLPLAANPYDTDYNHTYASHQWHGITMAYPMRVLVNSRYRLIHNINWRAPYPISTQIFPTSAFQGILNDTREGKPTGWYKTLHTYYYRDEWELYDLQTDPKELKNLAKDPNHKETFQNMQKKLQAWLVETNDPWRCMPHSVLLQGECHLMDNEFMP